MDSRRLPGKALMRLGQKKVIEWPIDALNKLKNIKSVLATSIREADTPLVQLTKEKSIECFRGSLDDVASRTLACCDKYDADYFFRINGDSPFLNLKLLEQAFRLIEADTDMASNLLNRSYPYGVSCELINVNTFREAYNSFTKKHKEHITTYFYENTGDYKIKELPVLENDYSEIRFTIDNEDDLRDLNKFIFASDLSDFNDIEITELIRNYKSYMTL